MACAALAVIIAAVSFWYVILRPSPVVDVLFLVLLAAIVLSRSFSQIYTSAVKCTDILGHLSSFTPAQWPPSSCAASRVFDSVSSPRRKSGPASGTSSISLPIGFPLALWLGAIHFNFTPFFFGKTLATFFGALWVTALSEEFVFRGLLQQWLAHWTGRPRLR